MSKPPAKSTDDVSNEDISSETIIAAQVEKAIDSLIKGTSRGQVIECLTNFLIRESFSGPIAHPRHLREYESTLPGSADRIIRMAEDNLSHLQDMDRRSLSVQSNDAMAGRISGLLALFLLVGSALYAGMNGNNTLAGLLLGCGVIGVIATFVNGKRNGREK